MTPQQPTRRTVIATLTTLPIATKLAAAAEPAQMLTTAPAGAGIDVPGLVSRLHEIALHHPELSNRVDDIIGNLGSLLGDEGSPQPVLELVAALEERTGYALSIDWIFCGDGQGPNGRPRRMFLTTSEPHQARRELTTEQFFDALHALEKRAARRVMRYVRAIQSGNYLEARQLLRDGLQSLGAWPAQI